MELPTAPPGLQTSLTPLVSQEAAAEPLLPLFPPLKQGKG